MRYVDRWGVVKVDLGICWEIDRYTCMCVLEQMRHEEKDRERGMHVGGGARGILYRGGGVCEYENDEKSGGSEAWTVTREEGKLVFVLGTPG